MPRRSRSWASPTSTSRAHTVAALRVRGGRLAHVAEPRRGAEAGFGRFGEGTIPLPSYRRSGGGASVAAAAGGTVQPGARDPVFGGFFDMQISREQARRDREALERL